MGTKRKCAYCGENSALTNEHVFPECFRKTFDAISFAKTQSGDKAVFSALEIGDVCSLCNNARLSPLDTYLCSLNDKYFVNLVHSGDRVRFQYDYDLLLRMLLKIGYNVARARRWPLEAIEDTANYILGEAAKPLGLRIFLQLLMPTPVANTSLPVSPDATEVPPLPLRVNVADTSNMPGFILSYSISIWSYAFFVLREDLNTRRALRERMIQKFLKFAKGAYELTGRNSATIYASSVDVIAAAAGSPTFFKQLSLARELTKGRKRIS